MSNYRQIYRTAKDSLEQTVDEFDQNSFKLFLQNLSQTQNLGTFINNLFENRDKLGLTHASISRFMVKFGTKSIKNIFGQDYYQLWLQMFILKKIKSKQRIKNIDLHQFPIAPLEQQQFLKNIIITYSNNDEDDIHKKILSQLNKQDTFKQYMAQKSNGSQKKSKIKQIDAKQISKQKQLETYLCFLDEIGNKIGVIGVGYDFVQKRQKLKEFVDEKIQQQGLQKAFLTKYLKQIISKCFHFDINKSKFPSKKQDAIQYGLKQFLAFKKFVKYLYANQNNFMKVLQKAREILNDNHNQLWIWSGFKNESIISILIKNSLKNKQLTEQLNSITNLSNPNLQDLILNCYKRSILQQIIKSAQNGDQKKLYLNNILKIIKKQGFDLNKQNQYGNKYVEQLQSIGIPTSQIKKSIIQNTLPTNRFYIFDLKRKALESIFLTKQDNYKLLNKITDQYIYDQQTISSNNYGIYFIINNNQLLAQYNPSNKRQLSGPLIYTNLQQIQNLKNIQFNIIQLEQGKIIDLQPFDKKTIFNKVKQYLQQKDENNVISFQLRNLKCTIEINMKNFKIKQVFVQKNGETQMKNDFGVLCFIPKNKKKFTQQEKEKTKQAPNIYVSQQNDSQNDQVRGLNQQKKQQKIIYDGQKFKHIGVFQNYFDLHYGYYIIDNNVIAKDKKVIKYFQCWMKKGIADFLRVIIDTVKSKQPSVFNFNNKAIITFKQCIRNIEKQINIKLDYDFKNNLIVYNLKSNKQAKEFFASYLKYVQLLSQDKNNHEERKLQLTKDQKKYVSQMFDKQIKVQDSANKTILLGHKQQIQQLRKQLQSLDQIQEFTFQNPAALDIMKQRQKNFLDDINAKFSQINENTFTVQYMVRHHNKFRNKWKQYCQQVNKQLNKTQQIQIKNQNQYLNKYRQQFHKNNLKVQIVPQIDSFIISFQKKIKKQVQKALSDFKEKLIDEQIKFIKKSTQQCKIIGGQFIYQLKDNLQKILKKVPKGMETVISVHKNKNQYTLKANQITPQQQKTLSLKIEQYMASYKAYKALKDNIQNYLIICNGYVVKINKKSKKSNQNNGICNSKDFARRYQNAINEIAGEISKKYLKLINQQFQNFVKNSELDTRFSSKLKDEFIKQINKQLSNFNFFTNYIKQKIQQLEQTTKVKANIKTTVMQQSQSITKELFKKYQQNKIQFQDLKRYFDCASILLTIYYKQQLPITQHLSRFKQDFENSDIIMVKVGTGSGKSTVIPPYLVGLGYKKVIVTQPRRLPCKQIYKRISQVFGKGISGYQTAQHSQNTNNNLVYMTDGLLKMQVIFNQQVFDKIDVLIIDQIHERSANIDILLLLLSEYMKKPNTKLKLVLCSATIDTEIAKLFSQSNKKIKQFSVQTSRFPVKQVAIVQQTIIQKIIQLNRQLNSNQQMLVFFPGVGQVSNTVRILNQTFHIKAYAITGVQSQNVIDKYLQDGKIFISTAIAETSLTFRNLVVVIDSRRSRFRKFNPELQLYQTEETYSSLSSLQQRKGRLGRTTPGTYYHLVYQQFDFNDAKKHNRTQLQNIDFTNNFFQLLLKKQYNAKKVEKLLKLLNHDPDEFETKIKYSRKILQDLQILKKNGQPFNGNKQLLKFGNLGNPQHNYAMRLSQQRKCSVNMAYIIAFLMLGSNVSSAILQYIAKKGGSKGQIKRLHDQLVNIGKTIDITNINLKKKQIPFQMNKSAQYKGLPWFNVLIKIIVKAKQLISFCTNPTVCPNFNDVLQTLIQSYQNKIYVNQSIFGGDNSIYEKLASDKKYNYDVPKQEQNKIKFYLNYKSTLYSKGNNPSAVLVLSATISPLQDCQLSLCEQISIQNIKQSMEVELVGQDVAVNCFDGAEPLKQSQVFSDIFNQIRSRYNFVGIKNNYPKMQVSSLIKNLLEAFTTIIQPKRRNPVLKIDLLKLLDEAVQARKNMAGKKYSLIIEPDTSRRLFQSLQFKDFTKMLSTLKYDLENNCKVELAWKLGQQRSLQIKNAKNSHINHIIKKLKSFFNWFANCQTISKEQYKVLPQYLGDCQKINKQTKQEIAKRVNQIVDSKIPQYVINGYTKGNYTGFKFLRTARMVVVCWVLVTKFDCTLKGGFVRDWVVNNDENLNNLSAAARRNLLQKNPRNNFLQVVDDKITPSDIDAELSFTITFDKNKFKRQMKKLGIDVIIQQDGWRYHLIFDKDCQSGGFTADLIQPYTSYCYDTFDFDVNVMYIKKDHLSSIGMKISLQYQDNQNKVITRSLGQLIDNCINKKMKMLKRDIYDYRFTKFQLRGWKINKNQLFQPVCYPSITTQRIPEGPDKINIINNQFYQKMVVNSKAKIIRIQRLRNKAWELAFNQSVNGISIQIQRQKRLADPNLKIIQVDPNIKYLYHGTKADGVKGIVLNNYDSRYFNAAGMYGRGVYFADDPLKSHGYTSPDPNNNNCRQMFIFKAVLGKQQTLNAANNNKLGPSKGYHSILGVAGSHRQYILEKWCQAIPVYLITYQM